MAEALINLLLQELVTVAFDHTKEAVKLILTAETEVRKFSKTLKKIQAVLEDAEKQQVEKANVRIWLDGLNDVSYEMVDLLDEWNTKILKQQATGVPAEKKRISKKVRFSISSSCFCFEAVDKATHLYRIATDIKELNEKLATIAADKEQFEFHQSSTRRDDEQLIKPLETSSFVDISKIFGRKEATTGLLSKLLSDSSEEKKRVIVISVMGMGGMGKTTLAQSAYNNKNVEAYFELRIWVYVSKPFDGVKIAKAIIRGTGGKTSSDSTELQENLNRMSSCLKGKKCLIVLDDVWTEDQEKWESLKLPLIMETCAKGSKIVVTTRNKRVVEIMGATTHMINLEKLSDENCLALFNSIAYLGWEEDDATRFTAIGEKLAKRCDGLPLAAKTLGGLMHNKKKMGEWQEVLDSKLWALKEVQQVFQPLLLSYYELAPAVKCCLLYCATFPEDYLFRKHNLIDLWMSHDYLRGKDYKEKEKTGQTVFDTLVMRSFFLDNVEEVDRWDYSITMCCKMHDIVHKFVQYLNKNECFTVEGKEGDSKIIKISEEVRHLSLMYAPYSSPLSDVSVVNCKKLRTLATFDSNMYSIDIRAITQVKCLRTLNLSYNDIGELPEEIGELIHLRYLDLSGNYILGRLPDSLGDLYNLQTLSLMNCYSVTSLPENMGNLINLKHLYNMDCVNLGYLPRGLARLTNLQTLNYCPVSVDDSDPGESFKLGEMGSLDQLQGILLIEINGNSKDAISEAQTACLSNKKLHTLILKFWQGKGDHVQILEALRPHPNLENFMIHIYNGIAAPSWIVSLKSLRSLSLRSWSRCESLPSLGELPLLERLQIDGMWNVKRVGDEFLGTMGTQTSSTLLFPKLKKLIFQWMNKWENWEGGVGASDVIKIMPCLVSLEIDNCPSLVNLPLFLLKTPIMNVSIKECPRIIMPNWPENCVVHIEEDVVDAVRRSTVETDAQIGELITPIPIAETNTQIDEEINMIDHMVETELLNVSQIDVLAVVPILVLLVCAIMLKIYAWSIGV